MTVEELIIELEGLPADAEVRLAMQPSWPFEYAVSGTTEALPLFGRAGNRLEGKAVYLIEGDQIGYLPERARQAIGW